jgi:hypothetical protein
MVTLPREDYEEALTPGQLQSGLKDLRADIADAQNLNVLFNAFTEQFRPYAIGGEKEAPWGEFPGTEMVLGKSNPISQGLVLAKGALGGPEGEQYMAENQLNRSVITAFRNLALREGAGLTQTKQELANIKEEKGERWWDDPVVAREAIRRLQTEFQADLINMGMRPSQVLNEYRSKMGVDQAPIWDREIEMLEFPESSTTAFGSTKRDVTGAARDPRAAINPHLQRVLDMQQTRKPLEEMTVEELEAYNASLE